MPAPQSLHDQLAQWATRKGTTKLANLAPDLLAALSQGWLPTVNLVEWLAVDHATLARTVLASPAQAGHLAAALAALAQLKKPTAMQCTQAVGLALLAHQQAAPLPGLLATLAAHPSDSVRGWACYLAAADPRLDLPAKLAAVRPLAADAHFGVREIAWMALRPSLATELERAIGLLAAWATEPDENLRRFASEATRPRGVWCAHLEPLKANPALGLPILELLRADPAKYVQNSVANWLNDAHKTQPQWVQTLGARWLAASPGAATQYIVKRGLRSA
ncbi:MAG: HEAT repeat domain-containing protein [Bernardetiaceae bacterium]|nr:HEAT repeat domain-containing protein [Bernardetiaceae bacterium]